MEEVSKTLNLLQIANAAFKETLSHLNMRSENFICCILACNSKKIKGLNAKFRGKIILQMYYLFLDNRDL